MYLQQRIEELSVTLKDASKIVAEYILANPDKVFEYPIAEIASECFTSKATVSRFAKRLGFDGWRSFLKEYQKEIAYQKEHKGTVDVNYPFDENTKAADIPMLLLRLQQESLMDTVQLLDNNMLSRAVNLMVRAGRIVIFSRSPNTYLAKSFARKMLSIGKNVIVASTNEEGLMARNLNDKDCAILISYSGNNAYNAPMCFVEQLKLNTVPIISITSVGENYLRRSSDAVITISSQESLYSKISSFATEESINYIMNVLYAAFYARNYNQNRNYKETAAKSLEKDRMALFDNMSGDEEE